MLLHFLGLPDYLVLYLRIYILGLFYFAVVYLLIFNRNTKQTVHDYFTKSYVVSKNHVLSVQQRSKIWIGYLIIIIVCVVSVLSFGVYTLSNKFSGYNTMKSHHQLPKMRVKALNFNTLLLQLKKEKNVVNAKITLINVNGLPFVKKSTLGIYVRTNKNPTLNDIKNAAQKVLEDNRVKKYNYPIIIVASNKISLCLIWRGSEIFQYHTIKQWKHIIEGRA